MDQKKELEIEQLGQLESAVIEKLQELHKDKFDKRVLDDFSNAWKVFLSKFLHLNYEFTDEELYHELERHKVPEGIKVSIIELLSILSDIKFRETPITQAEFSQIVEESIKAVREAVKEKKQSLGYVKKISFFKTIFNRISTKKPQEQHSNTKNGREKERIDDLVTEIKTPIPEKKEQSAGFFARIKASLSKNENIKQESVAQNEREDEVNEKIIATAKEVEESLSNIENLTKDSIPTINKKGKKDLTNKKEPEKETISKLNEKPRNNDAKEMASPRPKKHTMTYFTCHKYISRSHKFAKKRKFEDAKKLYLKARELYLKIDYFEKKEIYDDLLSLYGKLSEGEKDIER